MGTMIRHEDWPQRLNTEIAAAAERRFRWGTFDCALWAADVVALLVGIDFAAEYRGHYASALGSRRALARYGAGSLESTLADKLGGSISPLLLQRGDLALLDGPHGATLGICIGRQVLSPAAIGLGRTSLHNCRKGWRI